MPHLQDIARVTVPGVTPGGLPATAPLKDVVHETWVVARHQLSLTGSLRESTRYASTGVIGQLTMRHAIDAVLEKKPSTAYAQLVYTALRQAHVAVCLNRDERPPVWWVSDNYSESDLEQVCTFLERQRASGRKLDDLEPADPTDPPAPTTKITTNTKVVRSGQADATYSIRAWLPTAFAESGQATLSVLELTYLRYGSPKSEATALRLALSQLLDTGTLFTRQETDDERRLRAGGNFPRGRRVAMYSLDPTVPEKTSLVEGMPTQTPAIVHANKSNKRTSATRAEVADTDSKVLEALSTLGPLTASELVEITGLPDHVLTRSLKRLRPHKVTRHQVSGSRAYAYTLAKPAAAPKPAALPTLTPEDRAKPENVFLAEAEDAAKAETETETEAKTEVTDNLKPEPVAVVDGGESREIKRLRKKVAALKRERDDLRARLHAIARLV